MAKNYKKQQKREQRKRERKAARKEPVYIRVIPDRTVDLSITKIARRVAKQAKNYTSAPSLKYLRRFLRGGFKSANKSIKITADSNLKDLPTIYDLEYLLSMMCWDAALDMDLVKALWPNHALFAQYIEPLHEFILSVLPLEEESTPFGTVYYGPHKPKIEVDGKSYTVAFSKHALDQSSERYSETTDIEEKMSTLLYVLSSKKFPWVIHGGQLFVEAFRQRKVNFYYRWGYFPIIIQGRFAVAKTALLPGMRGTPEEDITKKHPGIVKIGSPKERVFEMDKYRQQIYETDLDLFELIGQKPSNHTSVDPEKWKSLLK